MFTTCHNRYLVRWLLPFYGIQVLTSLLLVTSSAVSVTSASRPRAPLPYGPFPTSKFILGRRSSVSGSSQLTAYTMSDSGYIDLRLRSSTTLAERHTAEMPTAPST
ncbi:hypothetical protein GOBAR_AA36286 [Gossypium barbadense]|uniref:Uncharacterized protein n=1 Tax=Gossypium barbadense TaxID=3634 RepID=A0A2P5W016_GOSBA|nr:hypothetical protein GOBAR_AA36286 [Gossypium barbadense]